MDSTAIPWIMLASVGVAVCSAIAAAVSACFSWRSSRTAANAALTTLILKFRDQYATNEMFIDLRNLRAWHDKYGSQFAITWQQKLKNDKEAQIVDRSRRRRYQLFQQYYRSSRYGSCSETDRKAANRFCRLRSGLYRNGASGARLEP